MAEASVLQRSLQSFTYGNMEPTGDVLVQKRSEASATGMDLGTGLYDQSKNNVSTKIDAPLHSAFEGVAQDDDEVPTSASFGEYDSAKSGSSSEDDGEVQAFPELGEDFTELQLPQADVSSKLLYCSNGSSMMLVPGQSSWMNTRAHFVRAHTPLGQASVANLASVECVAPRTHASAQSMTYSLDEESDGWVPDPASGAVHTEAHNVPALALALAPLASAQKGKEEALAPPDDIVSACARPSLARALTRYPYTRHSSISSVSTDTLILPLEEERRVGRKTHPLTDENEEQESVLGAAIPTVPQVAVAALARHGSARTVTEVRAHVRAKAALARLTNVRSTATGMALAVWTSAMVGVAIVTGQAAFSAPAAACAAALPIWNAVYFGVACMSLTVLSVCGVVGRSHRRAHAKTATCATPGSTLLSRIPPPTAMIYAPLLSSPLIFLMGLAGIGTVGTLLWLANNGTAAVGSGACTVALLWPAITLLAASLSAFAVSACSGGVAFCAHSAARALADAADRGIEGMKDTSAQSALMRVFLGRAMPASAPVPADFAILAMPTSPIPVQPPALSADNDVAVAHIPSQPADKMVVATDEWSTSPILSVDVDADKASGTADEPSLTLMPWTGRTGDPTPGGGLSVSLSMSMSMSMSVQYTPGKDDRRPSVFAAIAGKRSARITPMPLSAIHDAMDTVIPAQAERAKHGEGVSPEVASVMEFLDPTGSKDVTHSGRRSSLASAASFLRKMRGRRGSAPPSCAAPTTPPIPDKAGVGKDNVKGKNKEGQSRKRAGSLPNGPIPSLRSHASKWAKVEVEVDKASVGEGLKSSPSVAAMAALPRYVPSNPFLYLDTATGGAWSRTGSSLQVGKAGRDAEYKCSV